MARIQAHGPDLKLMISVELNQTAAIVTTAAAAAAAGNAGNAFVLIPATR